MLNRHVSLVLYAMARAYLRTVCQCAAGSFNQADHQATCRFRVEVEACWKETIFGVPHPAGETNRKRHVMREALYLVQALRSAIAEELTDSPGDATATADGAAADADVLAIRSQL